MATVQEVLDWLNTFPRKWNCRGYEGEGGAWIIVDKPDGEVAGKLATEEPRSAHG